MFLDEIFRHCETKIFQRKIVIPFCKKHEISGQIDVCKNSLKTNIENICSRAKNMPVLAGRLVYHEIEFVLVVEKKLKPAKNDEIIQAFGSRTSNEAAAKFSSFIKKWSLPWLRICSSNVGCNQTFVDSNG